MSSTTTATMQSSKTGKPSHHSGPSLGQWTRMVAAAVPAGFVFGMAMQNGLITWPENIRGQFTFSRFVMLKMFLYACTSATVSFATLAWVAPSTFEKARSTFFGCGKGKSIKAAFVGGCILGGGMAIGGACPGMVIVQLGSGIDNALWCFSGGLCGAGFYGLVQPYVMPMLAGNPKYVRLEDVPLFKGWKYHQLAYVVAAVFFLPAFLLDLAIDWKTDLPAYAKPWESVWPAVLSGAIIGSVQNLAVLGLGDTLGSSSAYMTACAQTLVTRPLQKSFSHLNSYRLGIDNWWQVVYLTSAALGAYVSSQRMGTYGKAESVDALTTFIGGFFMLFGSRVASGCTSGHGISGCPLLSVPSFAAVAGMFCTAFAVGGAFNFLFPAAYAV